MYFKILFYGARKDGRVPLIKLRKDATIADLKILMSNRTKIPVHRQQMEFNNEKLANGTHLSKIAQMCQEISSRGNDSPDIELFDEKKRVCRLSYLADIGCGSPEMSLEFDMDMDIEIPTSSFANQCSVASFYSDPKSNSMLRDGCSSDDSASNTEASIETSSVNTSTSSVDTTKGSKVGELRGKYSCPPLEVEEDKKYRDKCDIYCCVSDNRFPYAKVLPEDRRYAVMIVNEDNPGDCDYRCILKSLSEKFLTAPNPHTLSFSQCAPADEFDCTLMIVCADAETQDWLIRVARPQCPPYKFQTFIRHYDLVRCTFVLPLIVKRDLCRIFSVLENQNCGLDTSKWCVISQVTLDPCGKEFERKVVYPDCQNDEVTVYIDEESIAHISNQCNKLKYMLWHLPVDFCPLAGC
ncbi:uncharacterized protein [Drosophila bipectinata]|uniref:uncharacterized protein n=1 Tax=Drosophila bipectinata TaxID=42026 RepID=UPI001C898973|nr:uncharacterized protein LOC108127079 [Drosophila bipectinata]